MFRFLFKGKANFDINEIEKIVYQKFSGEVSSMSIVNLYKEILVDPRYNVSYNWIVDVRMSKQLFKANEIDSFFSIFLKNANSFNNKKVAFILASSHQSNTISKMEESFRDNKIDVTVKKFPDLRSAYNWIVK